jgi:putative Holliday junction resolvase
MSGRRLLGIDYGERRVGVALSDPTGTLASPLTVIAHEGGPELVDRLVALVQNEGAVGIVIGDPRRASGERSPGSERAETLAHTLAGRLQLPVWLWNEWGSTVLAAERLSAVRPARRGRGAEAAARRHRDARRMRQQKLDRAAAAIILQDFLDAHRDRELPAPLAIHGMDAKPEGPLDTE